MRIRCPHCQAKAIITHSVKVSDKITEIYINCTGMECGARSVMRIYHAYTLTPPENTLLNSLHEQIAQMSPQARKELFQPYLRETAP